MNTVKHIFCIFLGRKICRASNCCLLQFNFLCNEIETQTSMHIVQLNMVNENLYPYPYLALNYIIAGNDHSTCDSKGK